MSDLRSFLRYLVPGITLLVELIILVLTSGMAGEWNTLSGKLSIDVGTALAGLVASGGLGYLLSVVHHNLFWSPFAAFYAAADQRGVLSRLLDGGHLQLQLQCSEAIPSTATLSQAGAWRVFTALWHSRIETSPRIKASTPRAESLTDLMHGAGSTLIASVLAAVIWLIGACLSNKDSHFWLPLFIGCALIAIHWRSYRITGAHAQGFTDLVLFEELAANGTVHTLRISRNELVG